MWSQSSQKLGLKINDYVFKSPSSPNPWQVCGHGFSWIVVTRKRHNSGCQFSWTFITRKRGFWVFLEIHHQEAWVFGNSALGRSKKKHWFSCMFITKKPVTWLEAASSPRRGGFVVSVIRKKCIISK